MVIQGLLSTLSCLQGHKYISRYSNSHRAQGDLDGMDWSDKGGRGVER